MCHHYQKYQIMEKPRLMLDDPKIFRRRDNKSLLNFVRTAPICLPLF